MQSSQHRQSRACASAGHLLGAGGNGTAKKLMQEVDKLPIKPMGYKGEEEHGIE